jgi:cysteine synthase A
MLPDTAERYLSTPLFDDIAEAMSAEEIALSTSTPGARFDQPGTPTAVQPAPGKVELDADAVQLVEALVAGEPVLMFALEWCEFCWSARKLFQHLGIAYRSIDLDSVAYQQNDRGGKIRAVLAEHTGAVTIPRIFIGGRHIGGCTELFDGLRDGTVQQLLSSLGLPVSQPPDFDPYDFFPKWLQPRKSA